MDKEINRLSSKQVKKRLKLKSCDLMHLREEGTINAIKRGNAYLYDESDVQKYAKSRGPNPPNE